jgi:hypothetical protein
MRVLANPMRDAIKKRVLDFVADPQPDLFDTLALDVLRYQTKVIPTYGQLLNARKYDFQSWRHAPLIPAEIFRDISLAPKADRYQATFLTSGTTGSGRQGKRDVLDLDFYHAGMAPPFIANVLGGDLTPKPWLSLIAPVTRTPESSLAHMVDNLAPGLATELIHLASTEGLDAQRSLRVLKRLARTETPCIILTTGFALAHLLESLEGERLKLAAGSRLMLTGGFKGRRYRLEENELVEAVSQRLGLAAEDVIAEYGMTELSSQAYGSPFAAPHWLKLRVVDPVTHVDLPTEEVGLVAFFDLLNVDNVSAILSSDLGTLNLEGRLTLLGRAPQSPLRGCSLVAEDWEMT